MRGEQWIAEELARLSGSALDRHIRTLPAAGGKLTVAGRACLNFSSNDYLDLASDPRVSERARRCAEELGNSATASRLLAGALPCHDELEARLADLKGYPAALLFGSGFLANAGMIPALVGRGDEVVADRLAHASIIDGVRLSGARLRRFRHNDEVHVREILSESRAGRKLVVTESVFSMDGDLAPLPEIAAAAERYEAMLLVDEAHATGVFGPGGAGRICDCALEGAVNLSMGTLSKALGGYGGFVACSCLMREWLVNRARGMIYSTALPPAVAGSALGALDVLADEPGRGARLLERAQHFRAILQDMGFDTCGSASQIVPVLVGSASKAQAVSGRLLKKGVLAMAVRPPTVPEGTARLRLSVTLAHSPDDLENAAKAIDSSMKAEGLS